MKRSPRPAGEDYLLHCTLGLRRLVARYCLGVPWFSAAKALMSVRGPGAIGMATVFSSTLLYSADELGLQMIQIEVRPFRFS